MAEAYTITKQYHEKKDIDIYVVRLIEKVDAETFDELKTLARGNHGYYSSFRGVNGFVFKTEADAKSFVSEMLELTGFETLSSTPSIEENAIKPIKQKRSKSKVEPKSHMPLHVALRYVIETEEPEIINDTRLVNILDDFHAYDELPTAKYILRAIIADGYAQKLLAIGKWDNNADNLSTRFSRTTGFMLDAVELIFQSMGYGLGWLKEMNVNSSSTVGTKENLPKNNPLPNTSKPTVKRVLWNDAMSEDETEACFLALTEIEDVKSKDFGVELINLTYFLNVSESVTLSCEVKSLNKKKEYVFLNYAVYDKRGRVAATGYGTGKAPGYLNPCPVLINLGLEPSQISRIRLYWN